MRFIPAARARIAQEALLGALYSLLEAAAHQASQTDALEQMEEVAALCADSAKLAAVIALVGRRRLPHPRS